MQMSSAHRGFVGAGDVAAGGGLVLAAVISGASSESEASEMTSTATGSLADQSGGVLLLDVS